GTDFAILTGAALALRVKPVRWMAARAPAPLLLRDAIPILTTIDDLPVPAFAPAPRTAAPVGELA
ncbi:hypothetical protein ABTN12_19740, partial [Acinetobacter baumannii]